MLNKVKSRFLSGRKIISGALLIACLFVLAGSSKAFELRSYTVINKSGLSVTSIYLRESGAAKWGDNIYTEDNKLKNNSGFQFTQETSSASCSYDVKFVCDNGKEYVLQNLDLCKIAGITLKTDAQTNN